MENIMESLGLMIGKETVLFDVTTGEIISKERTEVLAYLKEKGNILAVASSKPE